jgi:hypothetical protein
MANPCNNSNSHPDPSSRARQPGTRKRLQLRVIFVVVSTLLMAWAAAVRAQQIEPGQRYQGVILTCGTQEEAETLMGLVVSGNMEKTRTYLQSDDNSCDIGPFRFVVMQQVGETRIDANGNAWKIVEIALPTAEAFLLTTGNLVGSGNT